MSPYLRGGLPTDQELLLSVVNRTYQWPDTYRVYAVYETGDAFIFELLTSNRAYRKWADEYGMRFLDGARVVSVARVRRPK